VLGFVEKVALPGFKPDLYQGIIAECFAGMVSACALLFMQKMDGEDL